MSWILCLPKFTFEKEGDKLKFHRVCFVIPELILVRQIPKPAPGPAWVTSDLIKEQTARALQILATIDGLAAGLSSGAKKQVQDMARRLAEAGGIPEGMKLDFGKERQ
jgi:hypothetical protein